MNISKFAAFVGVLVVAGLVAAQQSEAKPAGNDWVSRSNQNTHLLLALQAKFSPESAQQSGFDGVDDQIFDLKAGINERTRQATREAADGLRKRLSTEKDPLVRQDLEILIKAADDQIRGSLINEKYYIPYFNLPRAIFFGVRTLLDDQIPAERRNAALVRLRKYAGLEPGFTPITELAEERARERLNKPGLLGPAKIEVEKDLATQASFIDGIGKLFAKYQIEGYQAPYEKLKSEFAAYEQFVRKEIVPRARADFRLPAEDYAFSLEQYGVDIPPAELAAKAHAAFNQIQGEMKQVAAQVAKEKGWEQNDYRTVIRQLKKDQIVGDAILPHYKSRLKDLEEIIRREKLLTLPGREARIRLASEAETASQPAPNMRPPRLVGNHGEQGEFVLPLNLPAPAGSKEALQKYDDFTYSAASWTLTAHEARPGHELQFASMVEHGVSDARAVYAFNSTNVEGWGLYAEAIAKPYMPAEGQLISLQARLQRAARAFLDPELQSGKVTPAEAKHVLMDDVVLSEAMANQEVERYTFRAPGQATSYFYGYTRLVELRGDVEKALGSKFNQQQFHDYILSQGLLPPNLLRKAVEENFLHKAATIPVSKQSLVR
jgi:Bacterial protein of unknown function (DUF885)